MKTLTEIQTNQRTNTALQKWGGYSAMYEALAYIIGFVGFGGIVNVGGIADPVEKVEAIVANQGTLTGLMLIVYVVWGASLVVLTLALHERLDGNRSPLARTATAFGIIWSVLVIAGGMIYNVGMETVATLYVSDPTQAATVWMAIGSVFNGLGGGVEVVGGIWVILLSIVGLRSGTFARGLHFLGYVVGIAGVVSVVPALSEISTNIFGLAQIVWFAWLGVAMLRKSEVVSAEIVPSAYK